MKGLTLIEVMICVAIIAIIAVIAIPSFVKAANRTETNPMVNGPATLLVGWNSLPNGLSVYVDVENRNLVYICANGTSNPTASIYVVPMRK